MGMEYSNDILPLRSVDDFLLEFVLKLFAAATAIFFLFCSRVSIFWKLVIWIYRKEEKKWKSNILSKFYCFQLEQGMDVFAFFLHNHPHPALKSALSFFFLLGVGSIFLLLSRVARSFYLQAFDYFIFSLSTIFNTVHSVKYLFLFCSSL